MNKNDVTIYHIAHALSVSPSTVSRALSNSGRVRKQTQDKIRQLANDLGYRPNFFASRLKTQRSHLIGAAVTQINSSVGSSVVTGAEIAASQMGYNLILKQSMNKAEVRAANIDSLRSNSIDGLIVVSSFFQESTPLSSLGELDIPVVIIETSSMLPNLPKKQLTDYANAYQLTKFLVENGCKRIAYLSEGVERNTHEQLLSGYRRALTDNNLNEGDKFVLLSNDFEKPWAELCRMLVSVAPLPDGVVITHKSLTAVLYSPPDATMQNPCFWLTCRKGATATQNQLLIELGKIAANLLVSLSERRVEHDVIRPHSQVSTPASVPASSSSSVGQFIHM